MPQKTALDGFAGGASGQRGMLLRLRPAVNGQGSRQQVAMQPNHGLPRKLSIGALAVLAITATAACQSGLPQTGTPNETAELQGALGAAEYGPATWKPSPNYVNASRKVGQVSVVVIHTTQGSFSGAVSWMQNPKAKVSAHYVVSKTGQVVQMVKEEDIAWHVGSENYYTIGIEHEGFVSDPNWVTPQMLDASSKLTCYLLKKWQLSPTKAHVKGHVEMPNQTHTDPGQYWPWDKYMGMVAACVNGTPLPCPNGCDDNNLCTNDSCAAGKCAHANNSAPCNDGNACTAGDKCSGGKCGGAAKNCDDKNPCTNDNCDGKSGNCVHANNSAGCNDNNLCTAGDKCAGGKCAGTAKNCDDKNPCTDDLCDAKTGACKTAFNAKACGDGTPCGGTGSCVAGSCQGLSGKACNDGNPCTDDSCDAKTGKCAHANNTLPCDDGSQCTSGDTCAGGACKGASKNCDDANPCTLDGCKGGVCAQVPVDGPCDDGNLCTSGDHCTAAACGGLAANCDDGQPCTADSCQDGVCTHQGGNAATKVCVGGNVHETQPCGTATKLIETCATGTACKDGKCAASGSDATAGDATAGSDSAPTGADSTKGSTDAAKPNADGASDGNRSLSSGTGPDTSSGADSSLYTPKDTSACRAQPRGGALAWWLAAAMAAAAVGVRRRGQSGAREGKS